MGRAVFVLNGSVLDRAGVVAKPMNTELTTGRDNLRTLVSRFATNPLSSPETRRAYGSALDQFVAWWDVFGRPELSRETVQEYRAHLQAANVGIPRQNQILSAIKKLAEEAEACGALSRAEYMAINSIKSVRRPGQPAGNWLDEEGVAKLIATPPEDTLMGLRDRAVLGLLLGTSMRTAEIARITLDQFTIREGRDVILDSTGKGGRLRTVPVHAIAAEFTWQWIRAAGIQDGYLLRAFDAFGRVKKDGLSKRGIYYIVSERYAQFGLAPHDLRRTIARIMHDRGAPLVDIQHQLGHASISTTMRYINAPQKLKRGRAGIDYWIDPRKKGPKLGRALEVNPVDDALEPDEQPV